MKIGILTSSRADYGIYKPLLTTMKKDRKFNLEIIAFGMHLSKKFGHTISEIISDKYRTIHRVCALSDGDEQIDIAKNYANTALRFSEFWQTNKYDFVFCLGDRFEMSAAVQAGIPYEIKFIHLYGGETTKGAIDNIYRHQLTMASSVHLTSTNGYKKEVCRMLGNSRNVFTVGSLSLDGINNFKATKKNSFLEHFKIPSQEFALVTFHPETVRANKSSSHDGHVNKALKQLTGKIHLVITMPNADTYGSQLREVIMKLKSERKDKITIVESFGKNNYFNAMNHCKFILGNSSSGIIEAASFKKYVVNVGERQSGRAQSKNILNSKFDSKDIVKKSFAAYKKGAYKGRNIYYKNHVAKNIIKILYKLK